MNDTASPPVDPMTELSHRLIRAAVSDDFDPFMLGTAPTDSGPVVRACFYYAVVMTPRTTVLFDNYGRGGMCDMVPDEMVAAWNTPELLASQAVTLESLRDGTAQLAATRVPLPADLMMDLDWASDDEAPALKALSLPTDARFAHQKSIKELLKADPELLLFLVNMNPALEPQADEPPARPRGPGPR